MDIASVDKTNTAKAISRYRPEIDGLRAFAVVAVIINHFHKDALPSGYLGVDIFFVISGYVITSSLFGRYSKDFKDFIFGFYSRRIKRLVPALSFFVLVSSVAICLFNPHPDMQLGIADRALFGFSNIALYKQSTDYFAQSTQLNIFSHTWSLGVEEQFYILFPFLIWFSGFGRQTQNGARNLFLCIGVLAIASLISFLYLYPINQPAAYFLMPSRFWEMATGCLLFIGFQKRALIERMLERIPPFLVLSLIVGIMFAPVANASSSTLAIVILSSILIACLKQQTLAYKVFTNTKIVYIGLMSYSLYLWHWGVLSISRWTIGIHWWSAPFQLLLIFILAYFSYEFIEKPLRRSNWNVFKFSVIPIGVSLLLITASLLFFLEKVISERNILYVGRFLGIHNKISQSNPGSICNSTKSLEKLSDPFDFCLRKYRNEIKPHRLFLLGDSHAGHLVPMIEKTIDHTKFDLGFINTDSLDDFPALMLSKTPNLNEMPTLHKVIEQLKHGDIVMISFWKGKLNRHRDMHVETAQGRLNSKSTILLNNLSGLAEFLSKKSIPMILSVDLPMLRTSNTEIATCEFQQRLFGYNLCDVDPKIDQITGWQQRRVFEIVARDYSNVFLWDPSVYFPRNKQGVYSWRDDNGNLIMKDQHHITKKYSESLSNQFSLLFNLVYQP